MNRPPASRRSRLVRSLVVGLASLVVGGLAALGMTAPAFASPGVDFTLKLTSKTGAALSGYDVYPIDMTYGTETSGDDPALATPVSGKPGYYTMPLVSEDDYTLEFSPNGAAANSGTIQFLGGSAFFAGATQFQPTSSNDFLAASIATGSTITGKVTGPTGAALNGSEVDAYQFDGTNWVPSEYTLTSSAGVFTFANAVPGSYRFEFYAPGGVYPPIYSGSAATLGSAQTVFVQTGTTVTLNQKMVVGTGAISGTALVSDSTDSLPGDGTEYFDGGRVPVAFPVTAESGGHATALDLDKAIAGNTTPANTGVWAIHNLPAGSYVVEMETNDFGEGTQYLSTLPFGQVPTLAQATVFAVTAGHTIATGVKWFQLIDAFDGASPQYTIEDSSNAPIEGAKVTVAAVNDPLDFVQGTSDANGDVTLVDALGNPITDDGEGDGDDNPLVPGYYTLTVIDPSQKHEPVQETVYLDFGSIGHIVNLANLIAAPGFSAGPQIDTGATAVGTKYTASATPTRGDATVTWQWLRGGIPIYGATSAVYVSTGADLNDQLSVRATASSFGFDPFVAAPVPVAGGVTTIGDAPVNATAPSITPTAGVVLGTTLQANPGTWTIDSAAASGLTFSYLWSTGATGSSYVVQPADVTPPIAPITVTVTAHKTGYTPSAATLSSTSVVPGDHAAPVVTVAPVVTKTVAGSVTTYSVSTGTWSVAGTTFSYAWSLGSAAIGTNSHTITSTVTAADPLTVVVTASKAGYVPGASASIVAVKGTDNLTQTVDPTILDLRTNADVTGTDRLDFGDHLRIDQHGTWQSNDGLVTPSGYTYQWYRSTNGGASYLPIAGATLPTYTVGVADMSAGNDTLIAVAETPVSVYYGTPHGHKTSVGQAMYDTAFLSASPSTPYLDLPLPTVSVSGFPIDGRSVAAAIGSWGTTLVTDHYQWYFCLAADSCTDPTDESQYAPIGGATASTLVLHQSTYGSVFVQVTGVKPGFVVQDASAPVKIDDADTIGIAVAPKINGITANAAHTGVTLTVTGGAPSVTGTTIAYTWQTFQGGTWTKVWTGTSYVPKVADFLNGSIRVEETAKKTGLVNGVADSTAYSIAPGTLKLVKAETLTTTTSAFTLNAATYSPAAVASVQWSVDGTADGAPTPSPTHSRLSGDAGKAVYATVTYSSTGYNPLTFTVLAQRGATHDGVDSIDGARYGDTLQVHNTSPFTIAMGSMSPSTYQWYSNGVAISGATHPTFIPTYAYIAHHITVRVTATSALYETGSVLSSSLTLGEGAFGTPGIPQITNTGPVDPGTVLTAAPVTGSYGTTGITFHYVWQRSTNSGATWATIAGATAATYTPVATDVTDELQVIVTAIKTGYTSVATTSSPVTVQYSPTLATVAPALLSGSNQVGGPLVLSNGMWNTPTLTFSYQWYVDGTAMPAATTTSFAPVASEVGDLVYATVTAHRAGYQSVTVSSNVIVVTNAAAPIDTVAPVATFASGVWSVSPGTWNVDGLEYAYQWQVGGVDVPGATSSSWTLSDVGSGEIEVSITVSRIGYAPKTILVDTGSDIPSI